MTLTQYREALAARPMGPWGPVVSGAYYVTPDPPAVTRSRPAPVRRPLLSAPPRVLSPQERARESERQRRNAEDAQLRWKLTRLDHQAQPLPPAWLPARVG